MPNYRKIRERGQVALFKEMEKEIRAIRLAGYKVVTACDAWMRRYGVSELDLSDLEDM
jgi:hypothetical protein